MVYPNPQPGPGWDVFSFARWVHSMSRCQLGMISEPQFRSGNFLATRFHRDVSKHTVDGGHAKSPVDGEHPMFFLWFQPRGCRISDILPLKKTPWQCHCSAQVSWVVLEEMHIPYVMDAWCRKVMISCRSRAKYAKYEGLVFLTPTSWWCKPLKLWFN